MHYMYPIYGILKLSFFENGWDKARKEVSKSLLHRLV